MTNRINICNLSEDEREEAQKKYKLIAPYINGEASLKSIAKQQNISTRTLSYWVKGYRTEGLLGLSRKARNDKGLPKKIQPEMYDIVKALYLKNQHATNASIYRLVVSYCQTKGYYQPSYRSVCNIIRLIPKDIAFLSHEGSNAYKQKYDLLCMRNSTRPNHIWQADHVLMDVKIANAKNKPEQPWLTIIIDDCSRAICGYELSFVAPSAAKTSLCLRHAVWRKSDPDWPVFGVPEILYTDHGSDFTSKHIEQVCINLKIQLIFSQIGQPRGRGKIERFFRTLNQKLLSDLRLLNNAKKLMSLDQLDQIVYEFIKKYNAETHSETKVSPNQRWLQDGFIPNILDDLAHLDLLLFTETKPRVVQRDGIHFQGSKYLAVTLAEYIGQEVTVRYSPSDIASIRVYHKGEYICQAISAELANQTISIKEIQRARNARRNALRNEINQQKSSIDAAVEACRKDLQSELENLNESNPAEPTLSSPNRIKIYSND